MRALRRMPAVAVLALVVVFVAGWGLVLFNSGIPFEVGHGATYEVTAIFDEVPGLTKGSEVKAGGVNVGRVADIALVGENRLPHVKLQIDDDFRLRQGATADLRLYSNAGQLNRYIALEQGKGNALRDGATVGLAFTDQPVEFDQVLRVLDRRTRDDIASVIASLDRGSAGRAPEIQRIAASAPDALAQTAELVAQINSDGRALQTAVVQGRRVVSAMAKDPASLGGFADRLGALLATTATRERDLAFTVRQAAPAMRSPRIALDHLRRAVPDLRALIRTARPAVGQLPPTARTLRPTLAAARPALREVRRLTSGAPADLRALLPLVRTATPVMGPLERSLCLSGPILDMARASAPDWVGGLQEYGMINSNYDANGHAARIFIHTPRITGGTVQPDEDGYGFVVKPFLRTPGANIGQPWRSFRQSFIGGDGRCR
jgi:phospholipid/cholesterol/gamma-HCH transport system substrate-binding protein